MRAGPRRVVTRRVAPRNQRRKLFPDRQDAISRAAVIAEFPVWMQDGLATLEALFHQLRSTEDTKKLLLLDVGKVTALWAQTVAVRMF